jgi:hypothetical protein
VADESERHLLPRPEPIGGLFDEPADVANEIQLMVVDPAIGLEIVE